MVVRSIIGGVRGEIPLLGGADIDATGVGENRALGVGYLAV